VEDQAHAQQVHGKEVLAERKSRLESLIADLESSKAESREHLASHSLTIEEIRTAKELAEQISNRIDAYG
jgi:hypothetical protein